MSRLDTELAPTIGLVVTSYRSGRFIDQALASVAAQTRRPDQVVVVDDASDDDTAQRVRMWDTHVNLDVIVQPENAGVARARNAGIGRLQTDVVAILDGDDILMPDHIELMAELHQRHGGIVTPMAQFWVPGRAPRPYHRRLRGFVPPKQDQLRRLIQRNFVFVASMVSRFDLDAVGGFTEGDRAQDTTADWDLWLRLAAKGCRITSGTFPTVLYRVVDGSMASDAATMVRCEILQLQRSRRYLPDRLEPTITEALANRVAELDLLLEAGEGRVGHAWRAIGPHGGDWRNRARALAGAAVPATSQRLLRRRGGW